MLTIQLFIWTGAHNECGSKSELLVSLAAQLLYIIERKGLVQRKHNTRSLLQKYFTPIRLQPHDLAHTFPFRHCSKNGGE